MRRRDVLRALALCLLAPKASFASSDRAAAGPRYVLQIILRGGIDPLYSFDPKTSADLDPRVVAPHSANEIVQAAAPLAPELAPAAPWAGRFALVHGVRVNTANHPTGLVYAYQLRTNAFTPGYAESFARLVGDQAGAGPRGSISFQHEFEPVMGGETFVHTKLYPLMDRLSAIDGDVRNALVASLERQQKELRTAHDPRRDRLVASVADARAFLDRLTHATPFVEQHWPDGKVDDYGAAKTGGGAVQRAAWLFRNDLVRTARIYIKDWDSHTNNDQQQREYTQSLGRLLGRTFQHFNETTREGRSLIDDTLFILHSELSRYPLLNGTNGKDHFPEGPVVLMGPGVRPGIYGATTPMMTGRRVDLRTGKPSDGGESLFLDDVGATLAHLCGLKASANGFTGRKLDFLLA
jgi:uncharacterized protein (DUF1501 family)